MYRHLLVPLDNSPLAVETVRKAVQFARSLGATITFFHAREDYAATSDGALLRVTLPGEFRQGVAGEARAVLSKAEVVAREANVAHASVAVTSDRPYEAIVEAAEANGCDLIFMASHGRRGIRGLVLGSQTQKVLQHSSIPVLVSAVETNVPQGARNLALATIGDEHRSLAAVIHGLEFVVRDARATGRPPSFPLLRAIVHYIAEFPERLHHPKEDAYLFRKLRERTSEYDATLDELQRQHIEGRENVTQLARAIARFEADPAGGLEGFAASAERFAADQMAHMRLETKVILPAALQHLTTADWLEIGEAFAANGDPRFSVEDDQEFRQLFARILNMAPADVVRGTQGADVPA
jgi:nucleotide-binding universal stress UspA family protein/hemerythrin-like domain-containing protein